jgi:hypothetical protein
MRSGPPRPRFVLFSVFFLILSSLAVAQQIYVRPLISEPVNDGRRILLKGDTHPMARPQFDVAAAPPKPSNGPHAAGSQTHPRARNRAPEVA